MRVEEAILFVASKIKNCALALVSAVKKFRKTPSLNLSEGWAKKSQEIKPSDLLEKNGYSS